MSINEEKSHQGLLLVVLFGVAFILRIPTISSPLARDEAVTFNHYAHLDILEILFNYPDSNQHALFSILSNICLLIFGDHEVVFRLPSLVMGVLAIPLAYYAFLSLKFPSKLIELIIQNQFDHYEKAIDEFYTLLITKKFMPNTPAIANFGNALGMGSACFVMGIEDNMESIMETLKNTALVFKAGGGMGYNFSKLRPEGDFVSTTSGVASGPISFIRLFDTMTEVIKQGGIRRGANMGILNINHPDIEKFIRSKSGNKALRNFNISVWFLKNLSA